ncbi:MAG: hypothetical protein J5644_11075 [Bacteroidales bacterium]|nr:hypothetical protein [Bacteroidales bacterium]
MLLNSFFHILKEERAENSAQFTIKLNAEHPIFQGHFPGYPITPGVCVTQMAVDLFSHIFQQKFMIKKAKNIKFINILKPDETDTCDYQLSWEAVDGQEYRIKAIVNQGDTIYAKMDLTLRNE